MRFLIIGDIYSSVGRKMIAQYLPIIKEKYHLDFIIANAENVTHGMSMNIKHYHFLKSFEIDVFTGGNHSFENDEIYELLQQDDVLAPINFNPFKEYHGTNVYHCKNKTIRVTSILGQSFMAPCTNPFYAFDQVLKKTRTDYHFVDFHAETTSEKKAFALHYDGQITALWGTHTHVMTNDDRLLPSKKTAFLTDVGMTGPYDSVIGVEAQKVIKRLRENSRTKFISALGAGQLCA